MLLLLLLLQLLDLISGRQLHVFANNRLASCRPDMIRQEETDRATVGAGPGAACSLVRRVMLPVYLVSHLIRSSLLAHAACFRLTVVRFQTSKRSDTWRLTMMNRKTSRRSDFAFICVKILERIKYNG